MNIHSFEHFEFETLGLLEDWARSRGHAISKTRFYLGETPPREAAFDALIVMGGPMGTYDEADYPWLRTEKAALRQAIENGKRVLGICLGSQLLAEAIGGRVFPGPEKEIGWFPVRSVSENPYLPETFEPLHWHGDTFELPSSARLLASSAAYVHQAFSYGSNCLGLQFHLEMTASGARELLRHSGIPAPSRFIESEERILGSAAKFDRAHALLKQVAERFIEEGSLGSPV